MRTRTGEHEQNTAMHTYGNVMKTSVYLPKNLNFRMESGPKFIQEGKVFLSGELSYEGEGEISIDK